ncbi:MAG: hypothetical protein H0T46_02825 [Deltaproteobacteria bacterium]|nr:hypothetical protein [Deltaproteobacteria bacterium]
MRALLLTCLAACGGGPPSNITVIDAHQQLAYQLRSNSVRLERTFTKNTPLSFEIDVAGNADAFPGPDQVPFVGELFVSVENPSALGEGAVAGELPDRQRYQLSNQFLPATVSFAWYEPDSTCHPGCMRRSTLPMTLVDNLLGGIAPQDATVQVAFTATLTGWVVSSDSPTTATPSIQLDVR